MPIYKMTIIETLQKTFFVEAPTEEEGRDLADQLYDDGEIVLDANDYVGTDRYFDDVNKYDKEEIAAHPERVYKEKK